MKNLIILLQRGGIIILLTITMSLLVVTCDNLGEIDTLFQDRSTAPEKLILDKFISSADVNGAKIFLEWKIPDAGKTVVGTEASIAKYHLYWKKGNTVNEIDNDGYAEIAAENTSYEISSLAFEAVYALFFVVENSEGKKVAGNVMTKITVAQTKASFLQH